MRDAVTNSLKDLERPELSLGEAVWNSASELAGSSSRTQAGRIAETALKRTYATLLQTRGPEIGKKDPVSLLEEMAANVSDDMFVQQFLTDYLFELTLRQIRTTSVDYRYNGAHEYHFAGGSLLTPENEGLFRKKLEEQCGIIAKQIAKRVFSSGVIEEAKQGASFSETIVRALQDALGEAIREKRGGG